MKHIIRTISTLIIEEGLVFIYIVMIHHVTDALEIIQPVIFNPLIVFGFGVVVTKFLTFFWAGHISRSNSKGLILNTSFILAIAFVFTCCYAIMGFSALLGSGEKRHKASGENNHFASDENHQSQSDENNQSQ